ncbi:MAG: tRNA (N(6)-L-threonylcarbamoyladenosine(37)-C(2))-methylthiotransferase MtaB [Bilifractor sp.]|nr:tRNA (N(6)-L-threonylcarbamoyladenosine(37)-C(2))-methylthiotransferase MtaB [Lachnospiraceae bacterium]MDY2838372.1 tRNA (N(6)-L-threonylcarbamoyladenosine(37)-C(2))-methylthiotransferase MtaB [Bilifractor sp.]
MSRGKKAALHNLGCKVNAYELEAMQQMLEKAGYEIVPFEPGADVYVINTCTVTNIADRKSRQMLHKAKKMNPDAIVAAVGCYAQVRGEELEKDPAIDLVIGSNRKEDLIRELEQFGNSGVKQMDTSDWSVDKGYENLQIDRTEEHTRAFIKVQDGCNQFCSYCIIPYARGRVRSRRISDVREEVVRLAASGVREIVVTGIHLCSYGRDLGDGEDLVALLGVIHDVSGIERIRLGSLEPGSMSEEVIRSLSEMHKVCPHFHLSLQSGCARTLRDMNRHYTPEQFMEVVRLLRKYYEHPAITTDIITGFPGETDADFEESRKFVTDVHFFETHIFPYSRREGTKAAERKDQNTEAVKKQRGALLRETDILRRKEFLNYYLGKPVEVLFEERIEVNGRSYWTGHGREYQKILLADTRDLTNEMMVVTPQSLVSGEYLLAV